MTTSISYFLISYFSVESLISNATSHNLNATSWNPPNWQRSAGIFGLSRHSGAGISSEGLLSLGNFCACIGFRSWCLSFWKCATSVCAFFALRGRGKWQLLLVVCFSVWCWILDLVRMHVSGLKAACVRLKRDVLFLFRLLCGSILGSFGSCLLLFKLLRV